MKIRTATECSIADIQTIAVGYWSSAHSLAGKGGYFTGTVQHPWGLEIQSSLSVKKDRSTSQENGQTCAAPPYPPNGGRKWRADFRALSSCRRWQRWRWKAVKRDVCPARTPYLRFVGSGPEGDFRCRSVPWPYLLSKEITWRDMSCRWCRGPVRENEDLSQDFMGGRAG